MAPPDGALVARHTSCVSPCVVVLGGGAHAGEIPMFPAYTSTTDGGTETPAPT